MPDHEYTPADALKLLLDKITKANPALGSHVRAAIDAGKDVQEEDPASEGSSRKRVYRKHVAYSDKEALDIALDALQAHFHELPQIVNAAANDFQEARVGPKKTHVKVEKGKMKWEYDAPVEPDLDGKDKPFEIEVETETTQIKASQPNAKLHRYDKSDIVEVGRRLTEVRKLVNFEGEEHGNTSGPGNSY